MTTSPQTREIYTLLGNPIYDKYSFFNINITGGGEWEWVDTNQHSKYNSV